MRARDHERRALHGPADAQPRRDPAGEGGLSRAERTGEHDQVAGAQHPPDLLAEGLHIVRRGDLSGAEEGVQAHDATCRRATRDPMRVTIS